MDPKFSHGEGDTSSFSVLLVKTRGMLLLTKAKCPLQFKMHRMLSQYLLIHFEAIKATIKEI